MVERGRNVDDASAGAGAPDGRIILTYEAPLRLGGLLLEPALRRIARPDGREDVIEPRVMQVLVALTRAEGRILSRDDLLASCWHGMIVGEDSLNRVISRLRRLIDGIGESEFKLETIARVGYRLIPANAGRGTPASDPRDPIPAAGGANAAKPSIAVLPFANLSGDADQDYFADGMVEEIVTALSRIRSIFVVASGSSLSLRAERIDAAEAARRLDVRYLLEGSVRRSGNRVRIAVKLIDTIDRGQIWADRFEDAFDDVFALQDRVALAVAGVIEPQVQQVEMRRAAGASTGSVNSYDLYLRALWLYRNGGEVGLQTALTLLETAIRMDPHYGLALGLAAVCHRDIAQDPRTTDPAHHRQMAVSLADQALRAASDDAEALAFAGAAIGPFEADIQTVIAIFDRALTLNPSSSTAWLSSGMMRLRAGEPDVAAEHLTNSMRLDPLSPLRGRQLFGLGSARFEQGRMADAASLLTESTKLLPMPAAFPLLIAALGHLGQIEEARAALVRFAALDAGEIMPLVSAALNARQRALCRTGLALAGLDSGAGQDQPA
jgi:TolB-like protein/Tfp pilus assembly protein PilF